MNLVPDSIQPVYGWKTWKLDDEGLLFSAADPWVRWKVGEPYKARCIAIHHSWRLVPIDEASELSKEFSRDIAEAMHAAPPIGFVWDVPPDDVHPAPVEFCTCGIYMASTPLGANFYGEIMGIVTGWGRVIPGTDGYRVQYAYPKELYASNSMEAEMLSAYGVPVLSRQEATFLPLTFEQQFEQSALAYERAKKDLYVGVVLATIACLSLLLYLALDKQAIFLVTEYMAALATAVLGVMGYRRRKRRLS